MTLDSSSPASLTQEAGTRLAAQVQDLGFQSARSVIGRFAQLFEEFYAGIGSPMEINPLEWIRPRLGGLPEDGTSPLRLPDAAPGAQSSSRMWLHNPTSTDAVHLHFWTPGLVAHDGSTIPAPAVAFDPPSLDLVNPDSSTVIAVSVEVPHHTTVGLYHGLVMVGGLPECAFPVMLRVVRPGAR